MPRKYRIREVDGLDEDIVEQITELNRLQFPLSALKPSDFELGHWWWAWEWGGWNTPKEPVAWAGMIPSRYPNAGYFKRVGVLPQHQGNGLQLRLMRAIERRARGNGWDKIYSDTTDNRPSDNNFIKSGYRLFDPESPWAFKHSLYWEKKLHG
jgi:GNAT superfamily N-acetyltransferase